LISRARVPVAFSIAAASLVASGRKFQRTQYWMLISMRALLGTSHTRLARCPAPGQGR
jgi:hypothetical protein